MNLQRDWTELDGLPTTRTRAHTHTHTNMRQNRTGGTRQSTGRQMSLVHQLPHVLVATDCMLAITLLSLVVSPVLTLLYETRRERKKQDGIVASYGPVIHDEEKKIVKAIYSRYAPKILLYAPCIQYTTELVSLSVCHILYRKKKSFF